MALYSEQLKRKETDHGSDTQPISFNLAQITKSERDHISKDTE